MKNLLSTFILFVFYASIAQPTVSFTFDDGSTSDQAGYAFEEWNQMLLKALEKHELHAVFFVSGNKTDEKGRQLLQSWNDNGHFMGNHTYSHPNFNSEKIGIAEFEQELIGVDTIISSYRNFIKLFRFPYLKEGDNSIEVNEIRDHLKKQGYRNGYVTIDASDWYINSRLKKRLKDDPEADISPFRDFYLEHLFARANFYEQLAYELTGRHIKHTLLLHHNLTSALFLDDLIRYFKTNGWAVTSANEAYEDPVFQEVPDHAGESIIWALAKDSGKFEDRLRYPAEDSRYEKERMDELGL